MEYPGAEYLGAEYPEAEYPEAEYPEAEYPEFGVCSVARMPLAITLTGPSLTGWILATGGVGSFLTPPSWVRRRVPTEVAVC